LFPLEGLLLAAPLPSAVLVKSLQSGRGFSRDARPSMTTKWRHEQRWSVASFDLNIHAIERIVFQSF
jgi:hypothetical protein